MDRTLRECPIRRASQLSLQSQACKTKAWAYLIAADRLALASLVAAAAMAAAAACTETADPAMCRYTAASGHDVAISSDFE